MVALNPRPQFITRLAKALRDGMKQRGTTARVSVQPVPNSSMYRFIVISPVFDDTMFLEGQDIVWKIASSTLTPEEQVQISMIMTLPPMENGKRKTSHRN